MSNLKNIEKETRPTLLSYYKAHYEDLNRQYDADHHDELSIDKVNESILMSYFDLMSLYIDRNGNYGWLVNFVWQNYPVSVILSDDKIRIYEGWRVLTMNYERIEDDAFGEMVLDGLSLKRWVKKDLYGEKGVWVPIVVGGFGEITHEQRNCYLEYLEKEDEFLVMKSNLEQRKSCLIDLYFV